MATPGYACLKDDEVRRIEDYVKALYRGRPQGDDAVN